LPLILILQIEGDREEERRVPKAPTALHAIFVWFVNCVAQMGTQTQ